MQHEPFQSRQKAIEEGQDIKSNIFVVEFNSQRMMVKDTDQGKILVTQVQDLKKLLVAYRTGLIKVILVFKQHHSSFHNHSFIVSDPFVVVAAATITTCDEYTQTVI